MLPNHLFHTQSTQHILHDVYHLFEFSRSWFYIDILNRWYFLPNYPQLDRGWLKKTQEFSHITRAVVACEPCLGITNCFFLLKTEIHTQILHTEPFLCNFMGPRYQQNKMGFSKICQCDKSFPFYFELLQLLKDGWNENNYKNIWSVWVTCGHRVLIRGY